MNVALLHDYLNQYGGGERVLEALMELFPEAPIYTLLYDENKTLNHFHGRVKETSFLDFSLARKYHRWFIPLMPLASNKLRVASKYELVISDTAGYAKGFNTKTKHISYIHTPLRYAWEPDYINSKFKNQNSKIRNFILNPILGYLRKWDYKTAQNPDILIANSQFIAKKIKNYYGREAKVIYPPVDTKKFYFESKTQNPKPKTYFLAVGRLMHYKRFDLIIEAFAKLGLPLKIVGSGPELKNLELRMKKYGAKNIEFLQNVDDESLRKLYSNAEALIFPQVEDFGLAAAEAQACGLPVIAYAGGGVLEIIEDKQTGIFFPEQTSEAIITTVKEFDKTKFSREAIAEKAKRFSKERFKKEIKQVIENITSKKM